MDNVVLKPSPFLKEFYVNENGETKPVVLRNYQKQAVLNLLIGVRNLLGEDTGLGKTMEVLTTIGYVWMKEPEYVPIVVTTKSALFQWGAEVQKFMQGMEYATVNGEPYERHEIYQDFFWRHNPDKKRLLFLTYDHIMKDAEKAVIRDRSNKPDPKLKKKLVAARKVAKIAAEAFDVVKVDFEKSYKDRSLEVYDHVRATILAMASSDSFDPNRKKPGGWSASDERELAQYAKLRQNVSDAEHEVLKLSNQVAPPATVPGILEYMKDLKNSHPEVKFMLVMDEVHKLKNHKSQFHEKTREMSLMCERIIGMTATPVKNRLMEFWSLFRIIQPGVFPKITRFQDEYCVMKMQPIGGGRKVPIVVGYRNLDKFVNEIELYYLSRKKYDVAKELPELISQEIECELYEMQEELYDLAEIGAAEKADESETSGGEVLAALTMVQQAVDSPCLIADEEGKAFEGPSSKVDALLELLENDAQGRKIIVFSKFERMISLIEKTLKEVKYIDDDGIQRKGYRYVRITGKENNAKVRETNKNLFQDPNSGVNIVLITMAGSESINLHAAEHFAFIDLPWSFGDYVQLTGRMVRIGSIHKAVCAHHFLGKRQNGSKTIDHHVLAALRSKKKLSDKVSGESLKGGLQFVSGDVANDVIAEIRKSQGERNDKKGKKAGDKGTALALSNEKTEKTAIKLTDAVDKPRKEIPNSLGIDFSDL